MSSKLFTRDMLRRILRVLQQESSTGWQVEVMRGDGSARRFFRISPLGEQIAGTGESESSLIAILPAGQNAKQMAEAQASFHIANHLCRVGVPVPKPFGFDPDSGLVVFEDLGETLLHNFVQLHGTDVAMPLFRQAVEQLTLLQVKGRKGFDVEWCCDTIAYDRQLMLERESGYFLERFWHDYLGCTEAPAGLREDFSRLADLASGQPADFLLHRDYQSRNLMLHQGRIRIIDFQGARLGPLGYDLASLLNDPYVQLSSEQRQALWDHYLDAVSCHISLDPERFTEEYYYMALQRNLQILGAFGYLTKVCGKEFFRDYLPPALSGLVQLLSDPLGRVFPVLSGMALESVALLDQKRKRAV